MVAAAQLDLFDGKPTWTYGNRRELELLLAEIVALVDGHVLRLNQAECEYNEALAVIAGQLLKAAGTRPPKEASKRRAMAAKKCSAEYDAERSRLEAKHSVLANECVGERKKLDGEIDALAALITPEPGPTRLLLKSITCYGGDSVGAMQKDYQLRKCAELGIKSDYEIRRPKPGGSVWSQPPIIGYDVYAYVLRDLDLEILKRRK